MKRRRILTLAGTLAALAVVLGLWWLSVPARQEPAYHGRRLSSWLSQLDDGQVGGISSGTLPTFTSAQLRAAEAIRQIGTNALPILLEDIHARPDQNAPGIKVRQSVSSFIARLTGIWLSFGEITAEDRQRWRAAQGMAALGPLAKPAIPELKRLLFTNYWHSSIKEAAYVLAAVGPEGIEILTNAVQPREEWSGMCAIWALGQHPAAASNVVPFLISATTSPSEGTACGAIQVLGLIRTDPALVVPALTNLLTSPNSNVRQDAIRALGQFGPPALPAVPALQALTNDPALRSTCLEALKRIQL